MPTSHELRVHHYLRWGILGTSPISTTLFNAIQNSAYNEVWGIAGRTAEKAKKFADKLSFNKVFNSYDDLLANNEIDIVYIGLPNHLHKEWIIRCAAANKHILCEKPLVLNEEEGEEIKAVLSTSDSICLEGLMYLHHPLITKLKEIIAENFLGRIRLYQAHYSAYITDVANKTAGGSLRNLGCYPISLIRHLAQAEPVTIQATGRLNEETSDDHQASMLLTFPDNSQAVITTADDIKMHWLFEIYGTEGFLRVNTNPWLPTEMNTICLHRYNEDPIKIKVVSSQSLYTYQVDALSQLITSTDNIEKKRTKMNWITNSIDNVCIIDNALRQIKKNSSIKQ